MTDAFDERDSEDVREADEHEQWLTENVPPHHM
jgi:hypothetical protein